MGVWDARSYLSTGDRVWSEVPESTITTWTLPVGFYQVEQGQSTLPGGGTSEPTRFFASIIPYTNTTHPPLGVVPESWGNATIHTSYAPRAIRWWQGRLWMFTDMSTLRWSNILNGADIDATNNIIVAAHDGDKGVAIVPARGSTPRLYLFKEDAIYALDVAWAGGVQIPSTENSLDTVNSKLTTISEKVGCVAPKTVIYSSGSGQSDIFFLSRDGFRSIRRVEQDIAGGAGLPISEPIRDVMDRVNWVEAVKAHAAVNDHKVYLSLPVDGATECNITMVYDLINKRWVGEYDWASKDSLAFNLPGRQRQLYLQWRESTGETILSTIYTEGAHVFEAFNRSSANVYLDPDATAVEYEEQTRAFVFGNYGLLKRWNWAEWLFSTISTSVTIAAYAKVDDGAWTALTIGQLAAPSTGEGARKERYGLMDFPEGRKLQLKFTVDGDTVLSPQAVRSSAWIYEDTWE
jgi:hypothetical protein